jgi:hypothetical protein
VLSGFSFDEVDESLAAHLACAAFLAISCLRFGPNFLFRNAVNACAPGFFSLFFAIVHKLTKAQPPIASITEVLSKA